MKCIYLFTLSFKKHALFTHYFPKHCAGPVHEKMRKKLFFKNSYISQASQVMKPILLRAKILFSNALGKLTFLQK